MVPYIKANLTIAHGADGRDDFLSHLSIDLVTLRVSIHTGGGHLIARIFSQCCMPHHLLG
jgi:hypothetical protein